MALLFQEPWTSAWRTREKTDFSTGCRRFERTCYHSYPLQVEILSVQEKIDKCSEMITTSTFWCYFHSLTSTNRRSLYRDLFSWYALEKLNAVFSPFWETTLQRVMIPESAFGRTFRRMAWLGDFLLAYRSRIVVLLPALFAICRPDHRAQSGFTVEGVEEKGRRKWNFL